MHFDVLGIATARGQFDREQRRRLGGARVAGENRPLFEVPIIVYLSSYFLGLEHSIMAMTDVGLPNYGKTQHFTVQYDDALSDVQGRQLASALVGFVEQDLNLINSWFYGTWFSWPFPIPIQLTNDSGGADWSASDLEVGTPPQAHSPTIYIKAAGIPGTVTAANNVVIPDIIYARRLFIAEVTEMFMAIQDRGWFVDDQSIFGSSYRDEGSKGEGLSKFLAIQFLIANGYGGAAPPGYDVTAIWLNSSRPDYVNNNPDDATNPIIKGCTTLFLFYLHDYLHYSINQIINSGGDTLADVYRKLTRTVVDPFQNFLALINSYYPPLPPPTQYSPATESLFPLSNLIGFTGLGALASGYTETGFVSIDRPALADLPIFLSSDDPALVSVPPQVTIKKGSTTAKVEVTTRLIEMPFNAQSTTLHATYGGNTISTGVEVQPPTVSIALTSSYIVDGDMVTAKVSLSPASKSGDVVVAITGQTRFANFPSSITIAQDEKSKDFTI